MKQSVKVEIKSSKAHVTRVGGWSKRSAPSFDVAAPVDASLAIGLAHGSIGSIKIDGDLELDHDIVARSMHVLRWSPQSVLNEQGRATITLSDVSCDLDDVEISVDMEDEAAAEADAEDADRQLPCAGSDLVDAYGAYAVGLLGALGALVFAWLMPAHQTQLLYGSGLIALGSLLTTEKYDSYVVRILCLVAAGLCLFFGMTVLPGEVNNLIYAAGLCSLFAVLWDE